MRRRADQEERMFARLMIAALMLAGLGTPALAQTQTGNLEIFRAVQRQVLQYPHFTMFDSVHAQIDNGVLTLTGKVTMPYKRDAIEQRVSRVDGIDEVHNRIEVLPASQFDDELRYRIARAIYTHPVFNGYVSSVNPPIHVIVERGRVTLEGVVNSQVEQAVARSIASSFNAFEVKSALKTEAESRAELEDL
jgi:hyperosmotically inducible protein